MATFDGEFFKGSSGTVVYKKYHNLQVIQAKPRFTPNSQTKGTKKAAGVFGKASTLAMSLKDNLNLIISDFYDGTMIYRLNTDVLHSLRQCINPETETFELTHSSFNRLDGFEFNTDSPLANHLFVEPVLSLNANTLTIELPELHLPQQLKFPVGATACIVNIGVGLYDLTHGHMIYRPVQSKEIKCYDQALVPAQQFNFEMEPGCLCIAAISLQYVKATFSGNLIINTKTLNPTAIIAAFLMHGDSDENVTKKWPDMKFKLKEMN